MIVSLHCDVLYCGRFGFKIDEQNGESASTRRKAPDGRLTTLTRRRAAENRSRPMSWSGARNSDWRRSAANRRSG